MQRIKATTGKHMGRRSVLAPATAQLVHSLRASGLSMGKIAEQLNADAVPTATGRTWHASTVRQILSRAA